jgi:hypothetical protein
MEKIKIIFEDTDRTIHELMIGKRSYDKMVSFTQNYELESVLDGEKKIVLTGKKKKTCRFCKKSDKEVTFRTEAHVITQQFNKSKPTSDFECDDCNRKFSVYESDFGHFFLIDRSLFGQRKKKKGKAKYKTEDGTIITHTDKMNLYESDPIKLKKLNDFIRKKENDFIFLKQGENELEFKLTENTIELELKVKPYRPLNVFRVFLKIGLSMINTEELKNYSNLLNLLNNEKLEVKEEDENKSDEISLTIQEIPVYNNLFSYPLVQIFRKRNDASKVVSKILVMFFGNKIYQIPLVTDKDITDLYEHKLTLHMPGISALMNPLMSKKVISNMETVNILENTKTVVHQLSKSRIVSNHIQKLKFKQDDKFDII